MADVSRVGVDETPDPVAWLEVAGTTDVVGVLWGLYYAIYYGSPDALLSMPLSVQKAYGRVQGVLNG